MFLKSSHETNILTSERAKDDDNADDDTRWNGTGSPKISKPAQQGRLVSWHSGSVS